MKVVDLVGKTFTGASSNKIISSAKAGAMEGKGILPVSITSYATLLVPVEYKGILIDINAVTDVRAYEEDIRFKISEISAGKKQIVNITSLEETIKNEYKEINSGDKIEFIHESNYLGREGEQIKFEGIVTKNKNNKTAAKINYLRIESEFKAVIFDIAEVETLTRSAFQHLLTGKNHKNTVIKENQAQNIQKYRSEGVIVGIYDGQLIESPIAQITTKKITRSSNIKSEHIRHGHVKYRACKDGTVHKIVIAPTVIHLDLYDSETLMDAGFFPNGMPSHEGLIKYRGKLKDEHLQALNEKNNYFSMLNEANKPLKGFDYSTLDKVFGK